MCVLNYNVRRLLVTDCLMRFGVISLVLTSDVSVSVCLSVYL